MATTMANLWRVGYLTVFNANQAEITGSYCENKQRPWLQCNGKCWLRKKVKAAEEHERRQGQLKQFYDYVEVLPVIAYSVTVNVWAAPPYRPTARHSRTIPGYPNRLQRPPGTTGFYV